jgi:hypothetical protein
LAVLCSRNLGCRDNNFGEPASGGPVAGVLGLGGNPFQGAQRTRNEQQHGDLREWNEENAGRVSARRFSAESDHFPEEGAMAASSRKFFGIARRDESGARGPVVDASDY